MFRLLNQAALVQHFRVNFFVRLEMTIQRLETYFEPALFEDIGKAALGQSPVQRHLTTFKPTLGRVTRARFLSLLAASGRLAQTRSRAASHPLFLVRRPLGRVNVVKT